MTKIEQRLAVLATEQQKLEQQLETQRANKQIRCVCGKMHRIKNCVVIQTHYYVPPSGCTDGAYWGEGELNVICPDVDIKNRLLFSNNDVNWRERNDYKYNAQDQFKCIYKKLFKEVVDDYKEDTRKWINNYYIDQSHKKFGLCVEGRDYKTYGKKK